MKDVLAYKKIHLKILVRADPERVYDAIATPGSLETWFTKSAVLPEKLKVDEALRPERLVFQAERSLDTTTVEISFEEVDDGTFVELAEHGYTSMNTQASIHRVSAWARILTSMKVSIERERPSYASSL